MVLFRYYGDSLKQVKFYVSDEEYEKLRKLAEEAGLSVPMLVKQAVFEKLNLGSGTSLLGRLGELEERLRLLEKKYEQLGTEVGRIERDLIRIIVRIERVEKVLRHSIPFQLKQAKTLAMGEGQRSEDKGKS